MKYTLLTLLACLAGVSLRALDLSGQWRADIETPNGLHHVLYTWQVTGAKLTGTALDEAAGHRREGQLTEGTVTNGVISFVTYYEADTGDVLRIEYRGIPTTNAIHFLAQVGEVTTLDFVARRVVPDDVSAHPLVTAGTWSWAEPGNLGDSPRRASLTLLEQEGRLAGRVTSSEAEGAHVDFPISSAKLEGDQISFEVVRELNGNKSTNSYSGKVSADKITGKISYTRNGEPQTRDWLAKRTPEEK